MLSVRKQRGGCARPQRRKGRSLTARRPSGGLVAGAKQRCSVPCGDVPSSGTPRRCTPLTGRRATHPTWDPVPPDRQGTMRRTLLSALVAALLLTVAGPVSAVPPERIEEPVFFIPGDEADGLVTFVSITRADLCAWAQGGAEGPPPVSQPITLQLKEPGRARSSSRSRRTSPSRSGRCRASPCRTTAASAYYRNQG
jgi:hypothetical protein